MESRDMKKELRRRAASQTAAFDPVYLQAADRACFKSILALPAYLRAQTLFCYVSMAREPDTRLLLERAIQDGKTVAVPLCTGPGRMEARRIQSFRQLRPGVYGILEPDPDCCPVIPPEAFDFAIIPCVACTRDGRRLGHGGGYYDRYLPRLRCPVYCLCREPLLLSDLPTEPFDRRVDAVLTETACYRTEAPPQTGRDFAPRPADA